MKTILAFLFSILIIPAAVAETFTISYENGRVVRRVPEGTKPVIGLALSGGGARGIAHIGVIETLQEKGIRVDRIAGTSMGSIIGGLYAAGYSTDALKDIITDIDWSETFSSTPRRRSIYIGEKETSEWPLFELRFEGLKAQIPSSWSSGQRVISLLSWLTLSPTYECRRDFDRLPIPFRSITTDLRSDRTITLGQGNLGRAIQASSIIPLLFSPVEREDLLLVDGGLKNNLPVNAVRNMGSDFVIAVAIEESMHLPAELDNPVNIADQVTSILMRNVTSISKGQADFVISPDMEAFSSTDFTDIPSVIEQGRLAAEAAYPALRDSLAEKTAHLRKAHVNNITVYPREAEKTAVPVLSEYIKTGAVNHFSDIADALNVLWSTGRYSSIHAELDENTGILDIELTVTPGTVIVQVNSQNHNPGINKTFELSSLEDGVPSMQAAIARVDSLLRKLRSEGCSFAMLTGTEIDPANDRLIVDVPVPHVTRILTSEGLKSRQSIILRELEINVGDVFDLKKVMKSVENLYGTNLYEWVYADVEHHDGGVGLRIYLKEKNWTVARFGLRYDETFNTEGRVTLTQENILGFGNQLIFTAHTGQRRQLLMLENKSSRIYKSLYTFSLKTYRNFRRRPIYSGQEVILDYEDERYGTVISMGQQMDKLGNAMLQFKTETIRTRFAPSTGMKNAKKEFRSLIFRSLIDSYDRYPFPRNGFMNLIFIESATAVLGGSEQFVKIYWGSSFARTYWKRHTFNGSFTVGTADPSIPDIDAFTLGGDATRLCCYNTDSAGTHFYADFPGMADEEKFGTRLAVGKLTYRLFIPRAFYLDFNYSAGNVWQRGKVITVHSLLQGYGVTGSFATFVGPLSFGWGITSEGNDRYYMSAGWEF